MGLLALEDAESGTVSWIDTGRHLAERLQGASRAMGDSQEPGF